MSSPDHTTDRNPGARTGESHILPFDTVRIARLLIPREADVGAASAQVPHVGDMGTVIKVVTDPHDKRMFRVEAVDQVGRVAWIADFDERELALADGEL